MRNRLAGFLPKGSCQGATSSDAFRSGHRSTVRRSAVGQIIGWRKKPSARSARTRRSVRSSRGRWAGNNIWGVRDALGVRYDLVRNTNVECRDDDFVKHTTSPSHRGTRGGYHLASVFKVSLPLPNIVMSSVEPPRSSVCRLQHVHEHRVPDRPWPSAVPHLFCSLLFEPPTWRAPRPRNLDTEQPSSYCYELPT